jgi:hypothetical protein
MQNKDFYVIEPKNCVTEKGIIFRPFEIDGKLVHKLNMAKMLSADANESLEEMNTFIDAIHKMIGVKLNDLELKECIKARKIKK